MKATISSGWEEVRTSFWFIPMLLFFCAIGLSVLGLWLDKQYGENIPSGTWWIYGGGADGARAVLAAITGSMITVTSVVFSITIVTLTLASGQFGPRLLRNFMRDTGNQVVLGTFIATFIYSLLILRSVRSLDESEFIPYISVTMGVLLVFFSVLVLIYFIHHVSTSIQAESIIGAVYSELTNTVDKLFPQSINDKQEGGEVEAKPELPNYFKRDALPIEAEESNYLRATENDDLMKIAVDHDLVIQLLYRPGNFVARFSTVLLVWPPDRIDDDLKEELNEALVLGPHRTLTQDAEYGIYQLVEIAVRALSPGINDPFTAINSIDRLAAVLGHVAKKKFPSPYHFDEEGNLRIIMSTTTFKGYLDVAFNQIRQNASSTPAVLIRLMEALGIVAEQASTSEQYEALNHHAEMVKNIGVNSFSEKRDKEDLLERYETVKSMLSHQV